jgi:hypothetical protein
MDKKMEEIQRSLQVVAYESERRGKDKSTRDFSRGRQIRASVTSYAPEVIPFWHFRSSNAEDARVNIHF